MIQILKRTPGVSAAKLGKAATDGWPHPFLEYRAAEKGSWKLPMRFDFQKPSLKKRGPYTAVAVLPGVIRPGAKFEMHVTNLVIQKWKTACDVEASLLFV